MSQCNYLGCVTNKDPLQVPFIPSHDCLSCSRCLKCHICYGGCPKESVKALRDEFAISVLTAMVPLTVNVEFVKALARDLPDAQNVPQAMCTLSYIYADEAIKARENKENNGKR